MTRLFLRLYLGVVGILIIAWLTQSWLWGERFAAQNEQVVRDALFGGVRNARDKYRFGLARGLEKELLANIKDQFDYPVGLHDVDPRQDFDLQLTSGRELKLGDGTYIMARVVQGKPEVLLFGPLPEYAKPSKLEVTTSVGAIFLFAAVAIAFLLRPVVRQFQQVESTASLIASGDLSARIEKGESITTSNLVRAFNDMAGQTESMVKSQRELLQAVSHELRTPLSRIHFAIDLIRTGDETTREQRLDSLTTAADDLDSLVGELISYVRLESTSNEFISSTDLGELVKSVLNKAAPQNPDISFLLDDSIEEQPVFAFVDPAGFSRTISNLVANATRFCKTQIVVSATASEKWVTVDVDDDGPGIDEADRQRAFQPFVRLSESGSGVGLGLSIVQRIVHQHQGSIEIMTSPPGGCRIRTTWPADETSASCLP